MKNTLREWMRDKTHLEALRTTELDVEIYISEYFQCLAGAFLLWTMNYELRTYTIDSIAVSVSETNPNDNLMMRRAGLSRKNCTNATSVSLYMLACLL